jgi:hypothetical protein
MPAELSGTREWSLQLSQHAENAGFASFPNKNQGVQKQDPRGNRGHCAFRRRDRWVGPSRGWRRRIRSRQQRSMADHVLPPDQQRVLPHRRWRWRAQYGRDPLECHADFRPGRNSPRFRWGTACMPSRRSMGTTSPRWVAAAGLPTPSIRMRRGSARGSSSD